MAGMRTSPKTNAVANRMTTQNPPKQVNMSQPAGGGNIGIGRNNGAVSRQVVPSGPAPKPNNARPNPNQKPANMNSGSAVGKAPVGSQFIPDWGFQVRVKQMDRSGSALLSNGGDANGRQQVQPQVLSEKTANLADFNAVRQLLKAKGGMDKTKRLSLEMTGNIDQAKLQGLRQAGIVVNQDPSGKFVVDQQASTPGGNKGMPFFAQGSAGVGWNFDRTKQYEQGLEKLSGLTNAYNKVQGMRQQGGGYQSLFNPAAGVNAVTPGGGMGKSGGIQVGNAANNNGISGLNLTNSTLPPGATPLGTGQAGGFMNIASSNSGNLNGKPVTQVSTTSTQTSGTSGFNSGTGQNTLTPKAQPVFQPPGGQRRNNRQSRQSDALLQYAQANPNLAGGGTGKGQAGQPGQPGQTNQTGQADPVSALANMQWSNDPATRQMQQFAAMQQFQDDRERRTARSNREEAAWAFFANMAANLFRPQPIDTTSTARFMSQWN